MNEKIFKKKILTPPLCEDIIELFEASDNLENNKLIIPKQTKQWEKIELILYKELLVHLNMYKNEIIMCGKNDEIIIQLNKKMYIKHFTIRKFNCDFNINNIHDIISIPNRNNLLSFIFYLNVNNESFEIFVNDDLIKPITGDLLFIQYDNIYKFKTTSSEYQYIIYGEFVSIE